MLRRMVWGRDVVDGFESHQQEFGVNSVYDLDPVVLLENRCDVVE